MAKLTHVTTSLITIELRADIHIGNAIEAKSLHRHPSPNPLQGSHQQ
jgi:hypothetical protein